MECVPQFLNTCWEQHSRQPVSRQALSFTFLLLLGTPTPCCLRAQPYKLSRNFKFGWLKQRELNVYRYSCAWICIYLLEIVWEIWCRYFSYFQLLRSPVAVNILSSILLLFHNVEHVLWTSIGGIHILNIIITFLLVDFGEAKTLHL